MNTIRKGKINRHEKITQVLLSGKPVTPDEIASVFKGTDQEAVLYRLSTNIYNIRKDGGIVKVIKEGRNVTAYQLVNYTEFDANGRYVGKQIKSPDGMQPQSSDGSFTSTQETIETIEA
jgi:phage repressor protein C with HTH and peptisase S24 domain